MHHRSHDQPPGGLHPGGLPSGGVCIRGRGLPSGGVGWLLGRPPPTTTNGTRKRSVHILLECFLVLLSRLKNNPKITNLMGL